MGYFEVQVELWSKFKLQIQMWSRFLRLKMDCTVVVGLSSDFGFVLQKITKITILSRRLRPPWGGAREAEGNGWLCFLVFLLHREQ